MFSEVEANPGIHVSLDAGLPGQHGSDGNPGKGGDPGSAGAGYAGSYDPYLWDSSFLNLIVQDGHVPHDGKSGDDGDKPNTPLKTFSVRGREWRHLLPLPQALAPQRSSTTRMPQSRSWQSRVAWIGSR